MMTIREAYDYLIRRLPIEKLPITWDTTGYTSEVFNRWVSDATFKGWTGDRPTGEEARVITSLLQVQSGHSLLDVACGYGRHDLLLAGKYNLKVTGIDISPGLITTARRLAAEQKLKIVFEVKHARGLSWNYEFDRAMIAGNSLSLFSLEDASIVLRNIYRALQPGGRLFADLDNKSYNCRYGISDTNWHTQPGGLTLQEIYFHNDTSVEVCRDLTFRTDAEGVEEFVIYKRIYSPDEIVHLFSGCGFRVSHVYGDWDLSSLETNSPKMLLVGSKE